MSGFNWPFGHRTNWRFDPNRNLRQKNIEAERTVDGDSLISECSKRAANNKIKPKLAAKQIELRLPIAEPTPKTVDEVIMDTWKIIDLLDAE
jgi:hypothetical protein